MDEEAIKDIFNKLASREMTEYHVKKADFIQFRNILVEREDFKHFRGIAGRGGDVVYRYMEVPRS